MLIRQEACNEYEIVGSVVKKAFETAEHSDGNEYNLVAALRESDAFVPELSLVAEMDHEIVGHIMFTKIGIGDHTELALAPLAVLPEYQNKGIGTALMREGHRIARDLGYRYSVVLGSERYYPRVGYIPADRLGIKAPFDVPAENFMAMKLREDASPLSGVVQYAREFGI